MFSLHVCLKLLMERYWILKLFYFIFNLAIPVQTTPLYVKKGWHFRKLIAVSELWRQL